MALNPPLTDWHGQRVWIIGASSGIGRALAETLGRLGARVAISARRAAVLDELALPDDALRLPFDACSKAGWAAAIGFLHQRWGGVDVWVHCAADYQPTRAWQLDADAASRALDVNLHSVYLGLATIMPVLLANQSGRLVLLASPSGYFGMPEAINYGPHKAALINLAEILHVDLAQKGIAVHLVNPGFVATRLTARNDFAMPALQTPQQAADAIVAGLARGEFETHFPRRFTLWLKLLRLLPFALRRPLLRRIAR
ncbi:SDR family NAD(P)-dependent oxidoreductase [Chitinilyticum piscinae]|uniref:SDR family NAD(P)-dependent oxidoreductase n=1 Tax=Chitinilyticum piscinae TaxID=2866724 RepID=A0A8J7FKH4_9NEIS|nr:SDR family NAD(P)-dependent oxidoreductase [Chitinilyticum piscinae]MBE9609330.1 SDR family NAD(P)-dependent oxidoreductase [Chitinilyticum piscinae]